jgi:hypothetical protein
MWTVRIGPEDREGADYPIVEALRVDEAAKRISAKKLVIENAWTMGNTVYRTKKNKKGAKSSSPQISTASPFKNSQRRLPHSSVQAEMS